MDVPVPGDWAEVIPPARHIAFLGGCLGAYGELHLRPGRRPL